MSDESIPWSKNGWRGYVKPHNGTPIGLFDLRCQKVSRVIHVEKLEPHQIEDFDPDAYWEKERQTRSTKNSRALKGYTP
jgi:hypothetical protein